MLCCPAGPGATLPWTLLPRQDRSGLATVATSPAAKECLGSFHVSPAGYRLSPSVLVAVSCCKESTVSRNSTSLALPHPPAESHQGPIAGLSHADSHEPAASIGTAPIYSAPEPLHCHLLPKPPGRLKPPVLSPIPSIFSPLGSQRNAPSTRYSSSTLPIYTLHLVRPLQTPYREVN
jgi:hypothetical protein